MSCASAAAYSANWRAVADVAADVVVLDSRRRTDGPHRPGLPISADCGSGGVSIFCRLFFAGSRLDFGFLGGGGGGARSKRYEIRGLSGDPETKLRSVMAALEEFPRPRPGSAMPMGLEISER